MGRPIIEPLVKLANGLDFDGPDGCWVWTGAKGQRGYGLISVFRNMWPVHRFSYFIFVDPHIEGLHIHHRCGNVACANPYHLEAMVPQDHYLITEGHGGNVNRVKVSCPQGHPYDETNTYIDNTGRRHCRECRAVADRKSKEKKRLQRLAQSNEGHGSGLQERDQPRLSQ